MIKGFFAGLVLVILLMVSYLIHHLGFFRSVEISEADRGPYFVLYQPHAGAYYKIADTIGKVETSARALGLDCKRSFGEYFDNPKEVEEDRLRSRGGCISDQPYATKPDGCEVNQIPQRKYIVAHFSGSPAIGPWKVYPAVAEYILSHRLPEAGPTIEIYSIAGDTIETEYLFPLK